MPFIDPLDAMLDRAVRLSLQQRAESYLPPEVRAMLESLRHTEDAFVRISHQFLCETTPEGLTQWSKSVQRAAEDVVRARTHLLPTLLRAVEQETMPYRLVSTGHGVLFEPKTDPGAP